MSIDFAAYAAKVAEIREMLGDDQDSQTLQDTLEGETDALDVCDWIIRKVNERRASASECAALASLYKDKQRAHENAAEGLRGLAGVMLSTLGEKSIKRGIGSIYLMEGRVSVNITAEDDLPTQLCKVTRTPDKTAIRAAIEAGETIPGAELVRGQPSVVVK